MAGFFPNWLTGRTRVRTAAVSLADAVVTRARSASFYRTGLAEDTFDGRFDLMALHGALVLHRLRAMETGGAPLAEALGEALMDRVDYALREEGVGDTTIARKVRKRGEALYGLATALADTLDSRGGLEDVEGVLTRNGLGGRAPATLASYTLAAADALHRCPDKTLAGGHVDWPQTPVAS